MVRLLVVLEVYSHRCLALKADTSLGGQRVARVLDRSNREYGLPKVIGTDNGPKFRSRHMDQWAYENGVKFHFIKTGTPTQNTHVESLNSLIRKRLLNTHWFKDLDEVREEAEKWRTIYNTVKRHGSLNKKKTRTICSCSPSPVGFAFLHQAAVQPQTSTGKTNLTDAPTQGGSATTSLHTLRRPVIDKIPEA